MKNKFKVYSVFAVLLVMTLFLISPLLAEEDNPPVLDKHIQDFLEDMKLNPENYYLLYNRTSEETDYLKIYLSDFLDYFGIEVSSKFLDDGRNFVLIEVPSTQAGEMFTLERKASFVQLYQESFLENQSYEYYLSNNWSTFDYLVIFAKVQTFYSPYSSESEMIKSQEEFDMADMNSDGNLSAEEMVLYYLRILTDRIRDYENNPIETDYIQLDKNEAVELSFGEREISSCPDFGENYIFNKKVYVVYEWQINENITYEDYCLNETKLMELTCSDGTIRHFSVECEYGCEDGACLVNPDEVERIRWWIRGRYLWRDISRSIISWIVDLFM